MAALNAFFQAGNFCVNDIRRVGGMREGKGLDQMIKVDLEASCVNPFGGDAPITWGLADFPIRSECEDYRLVVRGMVV
jgi:hypothetical protein